jgi:hypothetical protein
MSRRENRINETVGAFILRKRRLAQDEEAVRAIDGGSTTCTDDQCLREMTSSMTIPLSINQCNQNNGIEILEINWK